MEDVEKFNKENLKPSFYQNIVISILDKFKEGELTLTLPNGKTTIIGDGKGIKANLNITNKDFFKKFVLSGDIGFGEAYIDGDWKTSNLTDLIRWAIKNIEHSPVMSGSKVKTIRLNLLEKINKIGHFFNRNTKKGSKENISYHYDLSNKFYELMLDKTMSYSCGIFPDDQTSLYKSQLIKLQKICEDLDLRETDHVLEIGCGWGSFSIYAATKYGCKITGVTISKEQFNYLTEKIKRLDLADKITVHLMDYRDINGEFDKIVSIEMIEAVGDKFLPQYFKTIDQLLKRDGVAVIQAITSPDSRYKSFKNSVDFIQKHIFPGSLLPSVGAMVAACQDDTQLQIHNLRDIGLHYAKTLRTWAEKVEENNEQIKALGMNTSFFRKWNYYLSYCEAAFLERNISDVQMTLIKPNNTTYKYGN
jgi:cyclopropane-fatty-acyl-phospholipid synthase